MLSNRVSNPVPLALESDALLTALRGLASIRRDIYMYQHTGRAASYFILTYHTVFGK